MPVLFFDARHRKTEKTVPNVDVQDRMESRRLWKGVTEAIMKKNYTTASEEKAILEQEQRHLAQVRAENGIDWVPNFFHQQQDGNWALVEKNL